MTEVTVAGGGTCSQAHQDVTLHRLSPIGASESPIISIPHIQNQPNWTGWSVRFCFNHVLRSEKRRLRSFEALAVNFSARRLVFFSTDLSSCALLSPHAVDPLFAGGNAVHVNGSLLKPFSDPLSELAGINTLSSQPGSRRNLLLPLSRSFPAVCRVIFQVHSEPRMP